MKLASTLIRDSETTSTTCTVRRLTDPNTLFVPKPEEKDEQAKCVHDPQQLLRKEEEQEASRRRRKSSHHTMKCESHQEQTGSLTKRTKSNPDLVALATAWVHEDDEEYDTCSSSSRDSASDAGHCQDEDHSFGIVKCAGKNEGLPHLQQQSNDEHDNKNNNNNNNNNNNDNHEEEENCGPKKSLPTNEKPATELASAPTDLAKATTATSATVQTSSLPLSSNTPSFQPRPSSPASTICSIKDFSQLDPRSCSDVTPLSPDAYVQELFYRMLGYKPSPRPTLELSTRCYNSTQKAFIPSITDEHMANYDLDVVSATRDNNLEVLEELHSQGRSLSCCNRYGESLLHMACRRGFEDIVTFLTQTAGVEIRITDDCGRTPLHDALWHRDCQYGIVDGLLRKDPSLLFLCDKHGHTPFEYARREHWDLWKQFLWDRREHMMQALDRDVMELFRLKI